MAETLPEKFGRFRILDVLGRGAMGVVYRGEDLGLGRPVAIKVLHLEDLSDEGVERMLREAHTLARLEHPGIVPIHDHGRLADGRVYYAMKRVRGEQLGRHVTAETPVAERLRLFLKICETVGFAHAAGVLHRDLKPENVMVGEFGEVLILDWGVAKWTSEARADLPGRTAGAPAPPPPSPTGRGRDTAPGTILGTPAFMAPEQASGDTARIDARTDVYGLGGTLWFLLTGRVPGEPGSAPVPKSLESICRRAMAPDPAERYASAGELAADVQRFLEGARVLAHAEGPVERAARLVKRYRVPIGLVLAYLLVRVAIWVFLRR